MILPRIQRRLIRVGRLIEVDQRKRDGLRWGAWRRVMLAPDTWAAWVARWPTLELNLHSPQDSR